MSDSYTTELLERIEALEYALESPEWRRLTTQADQEFTRAGLQNLTELARVMTIKNPLIKRGVRVKQLYVWGQGWTVKAKDALVQDAIDQFLYDQKNDDVIGSHEARMQLESDLQVDGNLFFCFFVNQTNGRVRVRTIPFAEVDEIVSNPDDAKEPWFYKRTWSEQRFDVSSGAISTEQRTAYYPDWRYTPVSTTPKTINGNPVYWDRPVYHVKVGGFANWKFGLSEVYDALDWAAAYKNFLEDWASIVRSLRRFAWQITTTGGNRGVAAAKAKLNTTLPGTGYETNPPPLTGSVFVGNESTKIAPVSTGGATIAAEDGRRLLLMVAASFGLPETFFGDADVGTLATAKSLDRPTELMMENRQALWRDVFLNILLYVVFWSVKAPQGALRGLATIADEVEDGQHNESLDWGDDTDATISIEFPPLLQHDVAELVAATVNAATLGAAGTMAGTIDRITLSRQLLTLLGISNVDEVMEEMYPDGEMPEPTEPATEEVPPRPQAEAMMVQAVSELRDSLARLQEPATNGIH
jgi:hypothetical protein